jgi:SAM-dependent methyltransferase
MATYDALADHYDAVTGDCAAEAAFVDTLIKQADAGAVTLLELACGTGGIIAALAGKYHVSGLDVAERMLAVARRKLPAGTPLYLADMTDFALPATFDTVICVYQGINHLLGFPAWETFFDRVYEHLNEGGVFVFDISTVGHLRMLAGSQREVQEFGDNYLITKVRTGDGAVYEWNIDLYEREPSGSYRLLTQVIKTRSFPCEQIRAALARRFTDIRAVGDDGNAVTGGDGAERIWFVCTRPAPGSTSG